MASAVASAVASSASGTVVEPQDLESNQIYTVFFKDGSPPQRLLFGGVSKSSKIREQYMHVILELHKGRIPFIKPKESVANTFYIQLDNIKEIRFPDTSGDAVSPTENDAAYKMRNASYTNNPFYKPPARSSRKNRSHSKRTLRRRKGVTRR